MKFGVQISIAIMVLIAGSVATGIFFYRSTTVLGDLAISIYDGPTMSIGFAQSARGNSAIALHQVDLYRIEDSAFDSDVLDVALDDMITDLEVVLERSKAKISQAVLRPLVPEVSALYDELIAAMEDETEINEALRGRLTAVAEQVSTVVDAEAEFGYLVREGVLSKRSEEQILSGAIIFASLAMSCGLLSAVGFRLVYRFRKLNRILNAYVGGDLSEPVPFSNGQDEIGLIARTTTHLRQTLLKAQDILKVSTFKGTAFEIAGAPMVMTDAAGSIVYVNRAFDSMIDRRRDDFVRHSPGFEAESFIGKSIDDFHPPGNWSHEMLSDADRLPIRMKIKIGEAYIGLLLDAVRDEAQTIIGYVLEWRDQTDEMHSNNIINAIDSGQARIEIDRNGKLKYSNSVTNRLFHQAEAGLEGCDVRTALHWIDKNSDGANTLAAAETGEKVFGQFALRFGEKSAILQGGVNVLPDHKGNPNGYLLIGVDVTEVEERERKIRAEKTKSDKEQQDVVSSLGNALKALSDGNLAAEIPVPFSESYEDLRLDYNGTVKALRKAIVTVAQISGSITTETSEITSAADDLARRTEHQASRLEETAAALDELTKSVHSAAQGAHGASEKASSALRRAEEGGAVASEAVTAMDGIRSSSLEISKITSVIEEIAFQTNLLALNAGVEAARAGDAGRGFAVVAAEVRALAQRSSDAAQEINALISTSQNQVKSGVELVDKTGAALDEILSSVSEISDLASQIAGSAGEQAEGLNEINSSVTELDQVTQQNAAMFEETTAASHSVSAQAVALSDAIEKFQLETAVTDHIGPGQDVHRSEASDAA